MTAQADPFEAVRIKTRKPAIGVPEVSSKESSNQDPFASVRIKKTEGFSGIPEFGRHAARLASRVGEVIGGIPGDIQSLIQSGVFAGLEKLVGIPVSEESREKVKSQRAPTSGELKKFSQEATGGFTSPQGNTEKTIDEYAETVASLLGPMKFRKALGVGLGAVGAKKGLETFGFGEGSQEAGKLGTMFLLSALNPGGASKYATSQYNKADALSKGSSVVAKGLETNLKNLENTLNKGVTTAAKNVTLKPTQELLGKIKDGKIPVQDLTAAKRDINTLMGDPALLKRERNFLKDLGRHIDNAIKPFEKTNPEFSKAYRPANEIYGAVAQGNKASNYIKKTLGIKSILGSIVAETALGHPEAILPTLAIGSSAYGGIKTAEFLTRLAKSPQLQKYYSKALISAAKEDAGALRLYEKQIENLLKKDQKSK